MSLSTRKILDEIANIGSASLRYRANPVGTAIRYWKLYRGGLFSPHEIRFFSLLDPSLSPEALGRVVSKEALVRVQARLNPAEARLLTEDKTLFHDRCLADGLPVPPVLAVYDTASGIEHTAGSLTSATALARFLDASEERTLIVKPLNGVNGEGIVRLDRHESGWIDTHGEPLDFATLAAGMKHSGYRRWLIQVFVDGHPELRRLSRTRALQTVRAVTAIDDTGEVRLLATRLRLVCGDVPFDNFNYGSTGNVIANVGLDDGRIVSVVGLDRESETLRFFENHPATGERLIGYEVPQWQTVQALALRAARAFPELRTVGWDIGLSLPEPCLIEGNATWGILSGEPRMGEIHRFLRGLDASRRFTRGTVR